MSLLCCNNIEHSLLYTYIYIWTVNICILLTITVLFITLLSKIANMFTQVASTFDTPGLVVYTKCSGYYRLGEEKIRGSG